MTAAALDPFAEPPATPVSVAPVLELPVHNLSEAAHAVDSRRARSRQRKLGPSALECRRRAGYIHHRVDPSDESGSRMAAILGTWLHKGALEALAAEYGAVIETKMEDEELRASADAMYLDDATAAVLRKASPPSRRTVRGWGETAGLEDVKTVADDRLLDSVRRRGPRRAQLFQAHLYADLARKGRVRKGPLAGVPIPVEWVRLRFLARDRGAEYLHEQPYDPDVTAEAREIVAEVRASKSPEDLPRDLNGPGLSYVCDSCPFRSLCWGPVDEDGPAPQSRLVVDDADVAAALTEYHQAAEAESAAKNRKLLARRMLDATPPGTYGQYRLGWSGGRVSPNAAPKPDVEAMVAILEDAGVEVPVLPPKPSARSISVSLAP